jgi:hypothetical protein
MSTLDDQVKKAFAGLITANDSVLSRDQIKAIYLICENVDFARAVGKELIRLGIVKIPKEPTSSESQKT